MLEVYGAAIMWIGFFWGRWELLGASYLCGISELWRKWMKPLDITPFLANFAIWQIIMSGRLAGFMDPKWMVREEYCRMN